MKTLAIFFFYFVLIIFASSPTLAANTAASFNGTNGRLILNQNLPALGSTFTIEGFFYYKNRVVAQYQSMFNRQKYSNQEWGFFLNTDNNHVGATLAPDSQHATNNSLWFGENSQSTITPSTWNHVALTADGTNYRLFLNGKLIDTKLQSKNPLLNFSDPPKVTLGGLEGGADAEPFNGYVDEFRISNLARYSTNFSLPSNQFSPDQSTILLLHLDEGLGTTVFDSSSHNYSASYYENTTLKNLSFTSGYSFTAITPTLSNSPTDFRHLLTLIQNLQPLSIFQYSTLITNLFH